ncbi:hypothetical protein Kfla_4155 [Kribbella flavida DSM 17836]|uniref:Lantibiotic biosynthesis protein dehydration domain-containing protein n=1 Tax=Kribbella flavida (strain DSM 17836 / JCM 10339 / NBRC 14399) TaxID=479435 RepID=D2PSR4_KRIFD|nr:DUF4135 domain-containing protein [Kribbella flavida]ADB33202.1 hypothetical protein Kfla_4155 [Kribbella flavida DSM 17836]
MDQAAQRLAAAWAGEAGNLLPPVVSVEDDVLRVVRRPSGRADAELLAGALPGTVASILLEVFDKLSGACVRLRQEFKELIDQDLLCPANAALFGGLSSEMVLLALSGPEAIGRYRAGQQADAFINFLECFLRRLRSDRRGRVVGLTAHDAETHNGGQRVLRVDLADGTRLAYKPRPADTELLFLASEDSVFALLNALPPASGEIKLPVLRCLPGDGTYSWQEWIERPPQWGLIAGSPDPEPDTDTDSDSAADSDPYSGPGHDGVLQRRLHGLVLDPSEAGTFWHRAGSLTAACFGFGLTDLAEGNLVTGTRADDPDPLYYPIDLELAFLPVRRLGETALVPGESSPHHHVGMEAEPRLCSSDGPALCLVESSDGSLAARRRSVPWARDETRTVVADTKGNTGYAAYLPSFLRGMFDAWTLMCTNRPALVEAMARPAVTRVLLRATAEYSKIIDDYLLDGAALPDGLSPSEREQLLRLDVPYYYRSTTGGPLLHWDPSSGQSLENDDEDAPRPAEWIRNGEGFTLARLGVALRDAVAPVAGGLRQQTLIDETRGVRLAVFDEQSGEVSLDWQQAGRRITYRWSGTKVSLRLRALADLTAVRDRLLRLDAVDTAWRGEWSAGGFSDVAAEDRLRRLTGAAADWLRGVIDEHGWPGRLLVGDEAADAAGRLVQHLDDQVDFQYAALKLIEQAAAYGDMPARHVPYLIDAIRVAEGRPQRYGTKFEPVDGELVPCRLEDPSAVDALRAEAGLEPLAEYAAHIRLRFPLPTPEVR